MLALKHPTVARHGIYTNEHAGEYCVRIYEEKTLRDLCADLQWEYRDDLCVIVTGITATLLMRADGPKRVDKPRLSDKVKSVVSAGIAAVADLVVNGEADAPETLIRERRAICKACKPFYRETSMGPDCAACSCKIRIKTTLLSQSCPDGRW